MQDTLFERSAQPRADADEHLRAGKAAGNARPNETSLKESHLEETRLEETRLEEIRLDETRLEETRSIEAGIAETLSELDADDSGTFDLGAVPLDGPDGPRQFLSAQRSSMSQAPLSQATLSQATLSQAPLSQAGRRGRRRHGAGGDTANRLLMAVMLFSALLALVMVGFAYNEGFIP